MLLLGPKVALIDFFFIDILKYNFFLKLVIEESYAR